MRIVARVATKLTHGPAWVLLGKGSKFKWHNLSHYLPCSALTRVTILHSLVTDEVTNTVTDKVTDSVFIFLLPTEVAVQWYGNKPVSVRYRRFQWHSSGIIRLRTS